VCGTRCDTSDQCAPGYTCDASSSQCAAASDAGNSGGCTYAGDEPAGGARGALPGLALLCLSLGLVARKRPAASNRGGRS
jgi:hypothetical protein